VSGYCIVHAEFVYQISLVVLAIEKKNYKEVKMDHKEDEECEEEEEEEEEELLL